jgi:hypothetical protein
LELRPSGDAVVAVKLSSVNKVKTGSTAWGTSASGTAVKSSCVAGLLHESSIHRL